MPTIRLSDHETDLLDSALCDAMAEARGALVTAATGSTRELELRGRMAGLISLRQKLHAAGLELEAEKLPAPGQLAIDGRHEPAVRYARSR